MSATAARALAAVLLGVPASAGQEAPAEAAAAERGASERTGLIHSEPGAFDGYTLFAPLRETTTYLIDMAGRVVHRWEHGGPPGYAVYLLDDGSLLRCERPPRGHDSESGGRIQRLSWEGELLWDLDLSRLGVQVHHDLEPLPDGHVLAIVWEHESHEDVVADGRDPALVRAEAGLYVGAVLEIRPIPPDGGEVVWAWRAYDHRVQDHDPELPRYARLSDAPGRLDLNGNRRAFRPPTREKRDQGGDDEALARETEARMRALGYAGDGPAEEVPETRRMPAARGPRGPRAVPAPRDWMHFNAVSYSPEHDLILLSSRTFSEVFVIDHSTTTEEAAGSSGGARGRGGEVLYRWGNPERHGHGTAADRRLFNQHDARWIDGGSAFTVFNNGPRAKQRFSTVDEIALPVDEAGELELARLEPPFPPAAPRWSYVAPDRESFFGSFLSGAQRLSNGNTLVCEGPRGRLFEITREGRTVWEYVSPFGAGNERTFPPGVAPGAALPLPAPPRRDGMDWLDRRAGIFRATRIAPDHPGLRGRF